MDLLNQTLNFFQVGNSMDFTVINILVYGIPGPEPLNSAKGKKGLEINYFLSKLMYTPWSRSTCNEIAILILNYDWVN